MTPLEIKSGIVFAPRKTKFRLVIQSVKEIFNKYLPGTNSDSQDYLDIESYYLITLYSTPILFTMWSAVIFFNMVIFMPDGYNPYLGILIVFVLFTPFIVVLGLGIAFLISKRYQGLKWDLPITALNGIINTSSPARGFSIILFYTLPFIFIAAAISSFANMIYPELYSLFIEHLPLIEFKMPIDGTTPQEFTSIMKPGVPDETFTRYLFMMSAFAIYLRPIIYLIETWIDAIKNVYKLIRRQEATNG